MKAFRQNNFVKVIFDDGTSVEKEFDTQDEALKAWHFAVHEETTDHEIKVYFLGEDPDKGKHLNFMVCSFLMYSKMPSL